ncbi:DUF1707 SHOCT-like domain-containing protein [Nocardioides speluncae]|uniref:DUF1707 SHOCT-like domain-containing protein n=1 Tax=Nocardioides speluncae TaxID=2670337 RepID=UPI000D68A6C8|nr:DUF1707 domain-containing protein [Nocardioides speluncae]
MDQPDPQQLRISDADRHKVADVLRDAAGEGRLDFEELDERLEATYSAKVYADLVPILADLPQQPQTLIPAPAATPAMPAPKVTGGAQKDRAIAIMSGVDKRGPWTVPADYYVLALMGGANLDLRQASFAAKEVTITVNAIMGGAEIIVPPTVHLVMDGIGIMGGFDGPRSGEEELGPDSPTLRIKGVAFWGGVNVRRKRPRGDLKDQFRKHLGH